MMKSQSNWSKGINNWTIQIIVICATILSMFGIAAYMAYTSSLGWQWFLLAALAISAGFDFSESDCDDVDDGIQKGQDNCRVHDYNDGGNQDE